MIGKLRRLSRHSVVQNAMALYGVQAAQYILPWITFPYLTRVLGAEKFGLIIWAQAFIQYFVVVTEYGFNFSAVREVSIYRDDNERLSRIFSAVMLAKTLLMVLCFFAMMIAILLTPRLRENTGLFLITFLSVVANVLFPQWLFQGIEKMGYISAREIGARLLGLLPTFLLVHTSDDYLWAALVQSGSMALAAFAGLLWMPKVTTVRFVRVTWPEVRATFHGGFSIFLSTAAITLYTRGNIFILGFVASEHAVGLFGVAQRVSDAARSLVFPLSVALFPHVSHLSAKRPDEAINFVRRHAWKIGIPFAAMSIAIFLLAPLIIRLAGGAKYQDAVVLLRWMSPAPWALSLGMVYGTQFMLGLGWKKEWANMILLGGLLNFVILIPLIHYTDPAVAVAITGTAIEFWVLLRSFQFYFTHRDKTAPVLAL